MNHKSLALTGLYLCGITALGAQNTYLPVTEITPDYAICPSPGSVSTGDRLFVYQHAGAQVPATGEAAGQLTDLKGAGQYALAMLDRVGGDTLYFTAPVAGEFEPAFTQIVADRGPADRTVNTGQASAFDGRVGGILFLSATERLSLTGELSGTAAGFRGGVGVEAPGSCTFLTVANAYTYPTGDYRGSGRGEGIAAASPATALGRAPLANGGGGGNDHNTGGGGGGNTGAGGAGAVNVVNSPFLCRGRFPGLGGLALPPQDDRLYFGGGGGAGHANNTDAATGGRGGGIVVLWAPEINFGPGSSLAAAGAAARTISGDGAGGGGAGGSLLLYAEVISGAPLMDLRGGEGGSVENLADRCFGPGGGGSGGRLLVTGDRQGFSPELQLAGGAAGLRLNSNICATTEAPAAGGSTGQVQPFEGRRPVSAFQLSAAFVCAGQSISITDASRGRDTVVYRITPQVSDLQMIEDGSTLELTFPTTAFGSYTVTQLLVVGADTLAGEQAPLTVGGRPTADDLVVQEVGDSLVLEAVGARFVDEFVFRLGNGDWITTSQPIIRYQYPAAGTYVPSLLLVNDDCGSVTLTGSPVTVAEPLRALILEKDPSGCAPLTLDPLDLSRGEYGGRRWDFPGGSPTTSTEERPVVTYARPGRYTATLTLTDTKGGRDSIATMLVNVFDTPMADFSFSVVGTTVDFQNLTAGAEGYEWTFGDGQGSSVENPTHTYPQNDTSYVATLVTRGSFCSDTLQQTILLGEPTAIRDLPAVGLAVYPNPTTGQLFITGPGIPMGLYDLRGRRLASGSAALDLLNLPAGTYMLHIRVGQASIMTPVIRR